MRRSLTTIPFLIVGLLPSQGYAQTVEMAPQLHLDHVWTMMAAALVLFMQVGFMLLEAGSVRSKNSVNVAQKNLMDFLISTTVFGLIGFPLMFGASQGGWFGWSWEIAFFGIKEDWALTFFVFQMMFCGTAATIVSGAVAERMTMGSYLVMVALIAAVIYPVAGHWAWGGLLSGDEAPFLAKMGFMDFAGSTVVHSVGAWVGLAAAILIGPRLGRFDSKGEPVTLHGHSPVLASAGAIIIWIGWIGFNGGSTTAGTPAFAGIVANTVVAGAIGGLLAGMTGFLKKGFHRPEFSINGALAGLVGITAGCDVVSLQGAVLIGAAGAMASHFARRGLTGMGVDDPLGAVSVHGAAGVTGTLLVALIAPADNLLAGTRLEQFGVQLLGVTIFFIWTFGISWIALLFLDRVFSEDGAPRGSGLRVSLEAEKIGLNEAEHRAPLGMARLTNAMSEIAKHDPNEVQPLVLDPGDETFEAGMIFNEILDRQKQRQAEDLKRRTAMSKVLRNVQSVVGAVSTGDLNARVAGAQGEFASLVEGMNELLETMSDVVRKSASASQKARSSAKVMQSQATRLGQTASAQADRIENLHETVAELRTRILNSSEALRAALDVTKAAAETSAEARAASATMIDRIAKSTEIVATIGQSIDTIDDVALQTHLLSVNASVEAARAQSDSTSGFTVVATEIRALAAQSAETANVVRDLIKDVQGRSNDAQAQVSVTDSALINLISKNEVIAATVQELDAINNDIMKSLTMVGETIDAAKVEAGTVMASAQKGEAVAVELLEDANAAAETTSRFHDSASQSSDNAA